jgi:ribosomal protein S18 acetylase RimI-like enzyme
MDCQFCEKEAVYKCSACGKATCAEHTKLQTLCPSCTKKNTEEYKIEKETTTEDRTQIRGFVNRFWGEQEQLTFDKRFVVADVPAYVAKAKDGMVGFISFADEGDYIIIVTLGVLPKHQGSGVGKSLVEAVENEAKKLKKRKLLVSTSNDDLPALAFYQSLGFQIYEVKPNVIAEKHKQILKGINGLPIRDELRLHKILT